VNDGVVELMEAHSGHYRPSPGNFQALIQSLTQSGADLTMAKVFFGLLGVEKVQGFLQEFPHTGFFFVLFETLNSYRQNDQLCIAGVACI
jgi:hypothetical protein